MDGKRASRRVLVGDVPIGGGAPITIQSMTNTDTEDFEATYRQVLELVEAGCEIVRLSAPTLASVSTFEKLKNHGVSVPLVADIHFNYEIALAALASGADKIRINPGNIGSAEKVRAVAEACKSHRVPIRIGVNSGSLEKHILEKHGSPTPEALVESALYHAGLLEKCGFYDIILSVKASSPLNMIKANRLLAAATDYPLHLGVTEAGGGESALVKSAVGIGALLSEGIGDTVRVSLTQDPKEEIGAAREILKALDMCKNPGMDIVACPTCARTKINLPSLLADFKDKAGRTGIDKMNIKVALMGCAVNGPGEAREADVGIAGGIGEGLLFKSGKIIAKVPEDKLVEALVDEILKMTKEENAFKS